MQSFPSCDGVVNKDVLFFFLNNDKSPIVKFYHKYKNEAPAFAGASSLSKKNFIRLNSKLY